MVTVRQTLIAALQAIRRHEVATGRLAGDHSDRQWHAHTRLPRSTIRHIEADDTPSGTSIDTVEALAQRFHVEPWQLLVPGFDPANPPKLDRMEARASKRARTHETTD